MMSLPRELDCNDNIICDLEKVFYSELQKYELPDLSRAILANALSNAHFDCIYNNDLEACELCKMNNIKSHSYEDLRPYISPKYKNLL